MSQKSSFKYRSARLHRALVCAAAGLLLCTLLLALFLPISATEGSRGTEPIRYGYTTATGNVRYVYELFAEHTLREQPADSFDLEQSRGVTVDEVRAGLTLFLSDYPECFWVRNAYSYSYMGETVLRVYPSYSFTGEALTAARAALDSAVESILEDLPAALDTWETALYLHDLVADRVEYLQVGEHQTAYGALVSGKAVCAGYAAAYHLLLRRAGISAWTVSGSSVDPSSGEEIPHAWNLVWTDDDTCVWTDVTWDDQGERLYHAYFQISLAQMSVDHDVNTDIFTVPACNHEDESYFDVRGAILTDSSTPTDAAALFGAVNGNSRTAIFCYEGSDFDAWISANLLDLYRTLGGGAGSFYRSYSRMGNEIQFTLTGSFAPASYQVSLVASASTQASGSLLQTVAAGDEITPVTLTANNGYYFPAALGNTEQNGIRITRVDAKTLRISGKPTANCTVTLPTPSAQTTQATPTASFVATGADCGLLSGVHGGMEYSTDGVIWHRIESDAPITLTALSPCTLRIIARGNGEDTLDSAVQELVINKHTTPDLVAVQPTADRQTGSIPTDASHEYCTVGGEWVDCTGALESLEAGVYRVRVKATDRTLASDAQEIVIVAFQADTEDNTTENDTAEGETTENTTEEDTAEGDTAESTTDVTTDDSAEDSTDATTSERTDSEESANGDTEENAGATSNQKPNGSNGSVDLTFGCTSTLHAGILSILALLGAAAVIAKKQEE